MSRTVTVPHVVGSVFRVHTTSSVPSGLKALPIRSPFASLHCLSCVATGSSRTRLGFAAGTWRRGRRSRGGSRRRGPCPLRRQSPAARREHRQSGQVGEGLPTVAGRPLTDECDPGALVPVALSRVGQDERVRTIRVRNQRRRFVLGRRLALTAHDVGGAPGGRDLVVIAFEGAVTG